MVLRADCNFEMLILHNDVMLTSLVLLHTYIKNIMMHLCHKKFVYMHEI